ncbi:MAG: glycosyltransferase family 2 protein, partial [Proteobacteria bacterium]|nr:glycosyltransferase family 2 protein [Pseudomonadota bacterium]
MTSLSPRLSQERDAQDAPHAQDRRSGANAAAVPGQSGGKAGIVPTGEAAKPAGSFELTIIIPTFNERENVRPLIEILSANLTDVTWEAIFVDDDSPDGTAAHVRGLMAEFPNIRCIHRIGRRGLSSACVEGMLASASPYLAVIDGDLQHDLSVLPLMFHTLKRDQLEIVVGSRYVDGGGTGDWARSRVRISGLATRMGSKLLRTPLKDPMSGYFILSRDLLDRTVRRLTGRGFKILLDICQAFGKDVRFAEIPYTMRSRVRGDSKLDALVVWEFAMLLLDKLVGRFIPIRFIMFVTVGTIGAAGHIAVLGLMTRFLDYPFLVGQSVATAVAMTINFFLNNVLTQRDRKLHGRQLLSGLASFYLACSIGGAIGVVLANFLFGNGIPWWMAGLLGAVVGAVWNFAITSSFTWQRGALRS